MQKFDTIVIGGGASGIIAAISAKRHGRSVAICERMPRLGKKILATGNGRCNLLNENLDEFFYNESAKGLVKSVFAKFGKEQIRGFFKELGLELYAEENRIFPVTNQSASVLKILELELERLKIPIEYNFEAASILCDTDKFIVASKSGRKVSCGKLIIACGAKSYPALGSDGGAYKFAVQFGHEIIEPVPSAVALVAKDPMCHFLQGQKIAVVAKSVIGGQVRSLAKGDLLFTKSGISGTAILDISRDISIALNRRDKKSAEVCVDFIPYMSQGNLESELEKRIKSGYTCQNLLVGILPNKFGIACEQLLTEKNPKLMAQALKNKIFKITGTRGWNEAEFTSGGINVNELNHQTLESKNKSGLYFAGEIVDVDGQRGGYNLAWAWSSGFVAGMTQ